MSAPRPRLYRFVGVVHRSRLIRDRKKEDAIRTKQARGKKRSGWGRRASLFSVYSLRLGAYIIKLRIVEDLYIGCLTVRFIRCYCLLSKSSNIHKIINKYTDYHIFAESLVQCSINGKVKLLINTQ